jgi:dienelactone hydrolase
LNFLRNPLAAALLLLTQSAWALPKAPSILDYDVKETFPAAVSRISAWEGFDVVQATFPSRVKSLFLENNTVWTRLLLPKGPGPYPCVISLPILAGSNLWIESRFWKPLLDRGIAVLFVELPYQFHRRPKGTNSGAVFMGRSPETLHNNFAQAVLDVRRALTWLGTRPEVDKERLGMVGISLGALVGSATYAIDPRLKDAAFLLGGADPRRLLADSAMTGPILRRLGIKEERLEPLAKEIDPLLYKERNHLRPALLVNASWDRIVPSENGRLLHEAFPASSQIWVPGGHYSAILHMIWMPGYVARYFERAFLKR